MKTIILQNIKSTFVANLKTTVLEREEHDNFYIIKNIMTRVPLKTSEILNKKRDEKF